jgi:hypothetical protein
MKCNKNGSFAATIDLDLHKEYQFRHLKVLWARGMMGVHTSICTAPTEIVQIQWLLLNDISLDFSIKDLSDVPLF